MLTLKEIHKAVGGTLVLAEADAESLKLKAAKEALTRLKNKRVLKSDAVLKKFVIQSCMLFIETCEKSNASDLKKDEKIPEAKRDAVFNKLVKQNIEDAINMGNSKLKFRQTLKVR